MSVRKRIWQTNGRRLSAWVADYRGLDGKRHIQTFRDRKAALKFHEKLERPERRATLRKMAKNFARQLNASDLLAIVTEKTTC